MLPLAPERSCLHSAWMFHVWHGHTELAFFRQFRHSNSLWFICFHCFSPQALRLCHILHRFQFLLPALIHFVFVRDEFTCIFCHPESFSSITLVDKCIGNVLLFAALTLGRDASSIALMSSDLQVFRLDFVKPSVAEICNYLEFSFSCTSGICSSDFFVSSTYDFRFPFRFYCPSVGTVPNCGSSVQSVPAFHEKCNNFFEFIRLQYYPIHEILHRACLTNTLRLASHQMELISWLLLRNPVQSGFQLVHHVYPHHHRYETAIFRHDELKFDVYSSCLTLCRCCQSNFWRYCSSAAAPRRFVCGRRATLNGHFSQCLWFRRIGKWRLGVLSSPPPTAERNTRSC